MFRSNVFPLLRVFAACLTLCLTAPAQQTPAPQSVLAKLFQQPIQADWFDPSFLAQVSADQVQQLVKQMTAVSGPLQRVDVADIGYSVVLERAVVPTRIMLTAEGKIGGLLFSAPVPLHIPASLEDALKEFEKLSGNVSVVVTENGKLRAGLHPDGSLAVGSAFKLAVLETLRQQVAAGKHRWDEVALLRPEWKSLPSGVIQSWPDNSPLTLATLSNEMISISDNTAANGLLDIAGRQSVEAVAPRNKPFLSTREMFVLKAPVNKALLEQFRSADEAGKRAVLSSVVRMPLPDPMQFAGNPLALDIEWFFTANELCALMSNVEDLPAMHINPGLAKPSEWKQVAFKGGSESGVLNLTTGLVGKNGKHYCIAATVNDSKAVDELKFATSYSGVLAFLAKESAR